MKSNEVFVFGSNLAGHHGGGAARAAVKKFGAVMGHGVGMQEQSYAIPTAGVGFGWIRHAVNHLTEFATANSDKKFLVTPVGCGLGLWDVEDIAPLFRAASKLSNIWLPKDFWNELYD